MVRYDSYCVDGGSGNMDKLNDKLGGKVRLDIRF